MRPIRALALLLALGALVFTAQAGQATQSGMAGSFHALIEALNAEDSVGVQAHLADNFTLTMTGGTTLSGTEAVHVMMLMDTPISNVSVMPGGGQKGTAVVEFGGVKPQYTITYTGARGGKFASWTSEVPTTPDE